MTAVGTGAVGIAAGIVVAALHLQLQWELQLHMEVASTGTAISALSGAAATSSTSMASEVGALTARTVEE